MSILSYRNSELMNARFIASEARNQGDNLTIANKGLDSSHGIARQKVDQLKDEALLAEILNDDFAHCKDIN